MHAFDVLGDPVRRRLLELLTDGEAPAGSLTDVVRREFGISQPAVSQHLRVLETARLVTARAEGTRRIYSVDRRGVAAVRDWLDGFWDETLDAFKAAAERQARNEEGG